MKTTNVINRPWLILAAILAIPLIVVVLSLPWTNGGSATSSTPGGQPRESAHVDRVRESVHATAPIEVRTAESIGVLAETESNTYQASGVLGIAAANTGQVFGVTGISASNQGRGIYGVASESPTAGPTYGVYGESYSNRGVGVYGQTLSTEGMTFGGDFYSISGSGRGLRAVSAATGNGFSAGGEFEAKSSNGRGVWAKASATTGVTYGVFGHATSRQGFGVWSQGNLGVAGDARVSGLKSFRIDHPRDPENMFLIHYASEGPEPLNVYGGLVALNEHGEATIELPDYFGEINRDPRYHLTPIGAAMPDLHVAQKVVNNAFRIAGGKPNAEVSWEVKAVRNDLYVRSYGASVEVEKSAAERGRFQHPELHPQPIPRAPSR